MPFIITKCDGTITLESTHGGQYPDKPIKGLCYGTWNWYKFNDEDWIRWEGPSMCRFRRAATKASSLNEFRTIVKTYHDGNHSII